MTFGKSTPLYTMVTLIRTAWIVNGFDPLTSASPHGFTEIEVGSAHARRHYGRELHKMEDVGKTPDIDVVQTATKR
jgi:hypothetical protein